MMGMSWSDGFSSLRFSKFPSGKLVGWYAAGAMSMLLAFDSAADMLGWLSKSLPLAADYFSSRGIG